MKIITLISFLFFALAQLNVAQEMSYSPKNNVMSHVFGVTAEGGLAFGVTDYKDKMNYTGKASLEYYLPSTGVGNIGLRIFGQTGFISGEEAPTIALNPSGKYSTKFDMVGAGVMYALSLGHAVYPWISVGVSNLWFYPEDGNGKKLPNIVADKYKNHMLGYNGDLGVRFMVSKGLSVNFAGGIVVGTQDYLDDIVSGSSNDLFYTTTVGISYYFNREKDSDGDGVPDAHDMCPNTRMGIEVGDDGCPFDADGDGVPDYLDKCPNTPAKVVVDQDGCPPDFDRDGVPDYLDKCSNTPAGAKVDQNGCPLDSDKDGVADNLDRCPNTSVGVKVDQFGCPIDSDGDGVADNLDKCPNTPRGVEVNLEGCPLQKETVVIVKHDLESLVLSGDTNFESNKAKLLPSAYAALEDLLTTMKDHPEYKWEIGGYTDGVGSVNYNLKLSKQRAQAIADYLVSKGVKRTNLKIVGYGKASPIASNDTEEGRAMNRRVEVKLLSKGK